MKKFLVIFFFAIIVNINFSAKSIDLPKHYKFPKDYFKGKHYDSVKDFFLIATKKIFNTVIMLSFKIIFWKFIMFW